jgi:acetyl-CoA C-acetyltransferase
MADDPVLILGAARTPMGGLLGALAGVRAPALGAAAIRAAVERSGVAPGAVDEVVMGCVLPAGQGQAPARQASLSAGLPVSAGCTTVNKMCGSGMKAAMLAHDALVAGAARVVVAGGMESMSNAPHLLPAARTGSRLGHQPVVDHMFLDGLEDAYEPGRPMGTFAEDCAAEQGFTREAQDAFALESLARARAANERGWFAWEMTPVTVPAGRETRAIDRDEQPFTVQPERIPLLRPAFRDGGTVTAANASSISDGAAALVLARRRTADALGARPLARVVAHATYADRPARFPTAPVGAIAAVLERAGWTAADVDLWEVNEAFAVVTMAAMRAHGLSHDRVDVHGGACALGHPIGASGARIVVTLLGALRRLGGRRGVAALCIGGGEATAMAVEID